MRMMMSKLCNAGGRSWVGGNGNRDPYSLQCRSFCSRCNNLLISSSSSSSDVDTDDTNDTHDTGDDTHDTDDDIDPYSLHCHSFSFCSRCNLLLLFFFFWWWWFWSSKHYTSIVSLLCKDLVQGLEAENKSASVKCSWFIFKRSSSKGKWLSNLAQID